MVNPIAIVMMVTGALLLVLGIYLVHKRRKLSGTIISLLGLGAIAVPFLASYIVANP